MLLAVDVGNTQTVIGLLERSPGDGWGELVHHWRLETRAERTCDEHVVSVSQLLGVAGVAPAGISSCVVCSVVPTVTASVAEMAEALFGTQPLVMGPGVGYGIPVAYDPPDEVGGDRIANAVAALHRFGGPAVVVDFGTATTLDAISESGEYIGGAIVPGVEISLDALFSRAAALRRVELAPPRSAIGRSTAEAIRSGSLYGFAGQVDGLVGRFTAELGPSTVIATGGIAPLIVPYTETISHSEPWLTLHGLYLVHERNAHR